MLETNSKGKLIFWDYSYSTSYGFPDTVTLSKVLPIGKAIRFYSVFVAFDNFPIILQMFVHISFLYATIWMGIATSMVLLAAK